MKKHILILALSLITFIGCKEKEKHCLLITNKKEQRGYCQLVKINNDTYFQIEPSTKDTTYFIIK